MASQRRAPAHQIFALEITDIKPRQYLALESVAYLVTCAVAPNLKRVAPRRSTPAINSAGWPFSSCG